MKFEVLAGDVVIGWSAFEHGDPPMGVVLGRLTVTSAYGTTLPDAPVRVRPEGEAFFEPTGGVHIEDLSEFGPDEIEVSVLGLDHVTYERYLPHHVRAYEEQFRETQ